MHIVATPVLKAAVQSWQVKVHACMVRDGIIVLVISVDTQTKQPTDVENVKQS